MNYFPAYNPNKRRIKKILIPTPPDELKKHLDSIHQLKKFVPLTQAELKRRKADYTQRWREENREKYLAYKRKWMAKVRAEKKESYFKLLARNRRALKKRRVKGLHKNDKQVRLLKRHSETMKARGISHLSKKMRARKV